MKYRIRSIRCLLLAAVLAAGLTGVIKAQEAQNQKPVSGTQTKEQTLDTDLVIIGGGGAGMSAALRAGQTGMKVVLIEQSDALGGELADLAGIAPVLEETGTEKEEPSGSEKNTGSRESSEPEKKEAAQEESSGKTEDLSREPESIAAAKTALDMPGLLALYASNAADAESWLQEAGIRVDWEKDFPDGEDGAQDEGDDRQEAKEILDILTAGLKEEGVTVLTGTIALELVSDQEGTVTGVKTAGKDGRALFEADAVLLATGAAREGNTLADSEEIQAAWRQPEYGKDGGLMVDKQLQVVSSDGEAVKGLYAAGKLAGGVTGTDTLPGADHGWAVVSGKLAAENIASALGFTVPESGLTQEEGVGETSLEENHTESGDSSLSREESDDSAETHSGAGSDDDGLAELYVPGEYHASAPGMNGDIEVTVEFSPARIERITWESLETPEIGGAALESLSEEVTLRQGIDFDAAAGATVTSEAFRRALMDCIRQASVF